MLALCSLPPLSFVGRDSRESFRTICPYPLNSGYGELPAGGATVRRLTLSENRSRYEAEAPRFSVWVLSLFSLQNRINLLI